ncbi:MAG: hypothetical protein LBQ74_00045 [Prevotella sp.]|jgi:translation initiation factor 2 alpha subunit (eIF-2alpha)|nr:hypothetical protein [Prevotella sp.]
MIKFGIKYEGKNTFESIARDFKKHLSPEVINKKCAAAINETLTRSVPLANKQIRAKYTLTNKGLIKKVTSIKKANSKRGPGGLWGSVSIKANPIDMGYFKYKVKLKSFKYKSRPGSYKKQVGANVAIIKGRNVYMKHLAEANFPYVKDKVIHKHITLASHGWYVKGRGFVSDPAMSLIKMRGPSPYAMLLNKDVEGKMSQYIHTNFPARLRALLQLEVDKIGK